MAAPSRVRVAINGYGVIGKRVADAVELQDDMTLVGVCDVLSDYRIRVAVERGYSVYAATVDARTAMEAADIPAHRRRSGRRTVRDIRRPASSRSGRVVRSTRWPAIPSSLR